MVRPCGAALDDEPHRAGGGLRGEETLAAAGIGGQVERHVEDRGALLPGF